jgi:D-serine deaminase-like pyridoxal phosphate-dependent protein
MKITEPSLIIDKNRCLANIERMAIKAKRGNVIFRPHFKTHQSMEVGNWYREYDIKAITVSSVKMAKYFAAEGWNDITIAFPVNILEIDEINELASKIDLNIIVVDSDPLLYLIAGIKRRLGVFLKVDTGNHRTGISPDNTDEIQKVIHMLSGSNIMEFKGFLAHSGQTYEAKSRDEILRIYRDSVDLLSGLKNQFYNNATISIGDTPSCSLVENFYDVQEIRPGNFVFYDIMQLNIGVCNEEDISVALAAPVVAKHKDRNEIIVYGGAVHLSKDFIIDKNGNKVFGYLVQFNKNGWGKIISGAYVKGLSQEHGIIKVNENADYFMRKKVGDIIGILPVHSCLTADLMGKYQTFSDKVITMMKK